MHDWDKGRSNCSRCGANDDGGHPCPGSPSEQVMDLVRYNGEEAVLTWVKLASDTISTEQRQREEQRRQAEIIRLRQLVAVGRDAEQELGRMGATI